MTIATSNVWPINAAGEIVAQAGVGGTTIVGYLNENSVPTDINSNAVVIAGLGQAAVASTPITASRNLTAADNGLTFYNATANLYTLTLTANLPAGFGIVVIQNSSGQVAIAAGAGTTVSNISNQFKTQAVNAAIAVTQTTANAYNVSGSTGA